MAGAAGFELPSQCYVKQLEAWAAFALDAGEEGTWGLLASEQGPVQPGPRGQHLWLRLNFCVPPTFSPVAWAGGQFRGARWEPGPGLQPARGLAGMGIDSTTLC